ncbi:CCHC-type domain-containing protein [Citrus sinensis]|nr:CCHC-type domain-containing protein [Citrus sinensis]
MDAEDLIKRCRAIKLSDEEEGRFSFKRSMKAKGEKIVAGCLIGKVLHTREVSIEGLKLAMSRVWKISREVKIEKLGDNVFMFKFGSEVDKRSILVGGPWHFDRALIVLVEPVGIGDIKKQSFSQVSFWVQIHDVPIMCMSKEMATQLGAVIGKVEEVDTDDAGECLGPFLRLRISVDISKPLKKIIELEQEEEDAEDIPMRVMYERLPDFCFCCGRIGHQYRECAHYISQSKDELAYGPWLRAITITEKLRQSRRKDRWDTDLGGFQKRFSTPTKTDLGRNGEPEGQRKPAESGQREEPDGAQVNPGLDNLDIAKNGDHMAIEGHLMHDATKQGGLGASCKEKMDAADKGTVHRERDMRSECMGGKEKEREAGNQNKNLENGQLSSLEKAGKFVRVIDDSKGALVTIVEIQKTTEVTSQMESKIENVDNGPREDRIKPKKRKWKLQARSVEDIVGAKEGMPNSKRLASSMDWESPRSKKNKTSSSQTEKRPSHYQKVPVIGTKLNFENEESAGWAKDQNEKKETLAEAGSQPRRQP